MKKRMSERTEKSLEGRKSACKETAGFCRSDRERTIGGGQEEWFYRQAERTGV